MSDLEDEGISGLDIRDIEMLTLYAHHFRFSQNGC
jgi:hypothetical protein